MINSRLLKIGLIVSAGLLTLACSDEPGNNSSPNEQVSLNDQRVDGLEAEIAPLWQNIALQGETICALGGPYSVWVRRANPKKLAIILAGGGACWRGVDCEPSAHKGSSDRMVYTAQQSENDNPSARGGIFNLAHRHNPLADYSLIFARQCTGDFAFGDAVTTYEVPAVDDRLPHQVAVNHKGYVNNQAMLQWVYKNYPELENVLITAWGTAAVSSPLYAGLVAEVYASAQITHLADGGGAYRVGKKLQPLFISYGSDEVLKHFKGFEQGEEADQLSFEDFYIRTAQNYPQISFHQYNSHNDASARLLLEQWQESADSLEKLREEAHGYIRTHMRNFRSWTNWGGKGNIIGGYYDGILAQGNDNNGQPYSVDRFYSYQVDGYKFYQWFADIVAGRQVHNVHCTDCDNPEYDQSNAPEAIRE